MATDISNEAHSLLAFCPKLSDLATGRDYGAFFILPLQGSAADELPEQVTLQGKRRALCSKPLPNLLIFGLAGKSLRPAHTQPAGPLQ